MQWNWNILGKEVEKARRACVPRGQLGHEEAAERLHRAIRAAWPPGFFDQLQRCKQGDAAALDDILDFIEAAPRFNRTGYVLDDALRAILRPPRTETQAARMREIALAATARRSRVPFRRIPRLAREVVSPELRRRLLHLVDDPDPEVRQRAIAVLDSLPGPPWNDARARARRADDRVQSLLATSRGESVPLLRKLLATEPRSLTSQGRNWLAVAFEHAMNLRLLPDDELLGIARRLDGPEMEPIWRFALRRADETGDRARWMLGNIRSIEE